MPAHVKSSLLDSGLTIPVRGGNGAGNLAGHLFVRTPQSRRTAVIGPDVDGRCRMIVRCGRTSRIAARTPGVDRLARSSSQLSNVVDRFTLRSTCPSASSERSRHAATRSRESAGERPRNAVMACVVAAASSSSSAALVPESAAEAADKTRQRSQSLVASAGGGLRCARHDR